MLSLVALLAAPAAQAAADVTVAVTAPTVAVDQSGTTTVRVSNIGNKSASAVVLTINLPTTNTSPTVYPMGTVGTLDSRCSRSGTKITCNLGTVARGTSTNVAFAMAFPQAAQTLLISASATTTSAENSATNNSGSAVVTPTNTEIAVWDGATAAIDHCTGTNLTSYFECELFPSSISSHEHTFLAGGSIFIAEAPDYTGTWSQPDADTLVFSYSDETGALVAEFVGYGVSTDCFEGITTFPGSTYVSPYSVCLY